MENKRTENINLFFYQIIDLHRGLAINFSNYSSKKEN